MGRVSGPSIKPQHTAYAVDERNAILALVTNRINTELAVAKVAHLRGDDDVAVVRNTRAEILQELRAEITTRAVR